MTDPHLPAFAADAALLLRVRPRQLLLLATLDTQRHLGRAAQAMNISQPAATKLLLQLEDALGERLFERSPRGMSPTPNGELLVRYARRVLADFSAVREEMGALRSGLSGALRLGAVPGAVPQLLAPALLDYRSRHPQVALSVAVGTSDVVLGQLARGDVDLALGRLTEGFSEREFDIEPLLEEAMQVVVRAAHPVFERGKAVLADLAGWSWVLQAPGSPQRGRLEAALREAGVHGRLDFIETASTTVTTALVEMSDMAALMPASLAAHYARLGVLRVAPIELPIRLPAIDLIVPQGRALSPAAAHFRRLLLGRRG
jgi:DNA-binding transcriptional LysR family regulator